MVDHAGDFKHFSFDSHVANHGQVLSPGMSLFPYVPEATDFFGPVTISAFGKAVMCHWVRELFTLHCAVAKLNLFLLKPG